MISRRAIFYFLFVLLVVGCGNSTTAMEADETLYDPCHEVLAIIYTNKGDGFIDNLISEKNIRIENFVPATYSTNSNTFDTDDIAKFRNILEDDLLKNNIVDVFNNNYDSHTVVLIVNFIALVIEENSGNYEGFIELKMARGEARETTAYNVILSINQINNNEEYSLLDYKIKLMEKISSEIVEDISAFVDKKTDGICKQ